jgi:hypothetical protein
MTAPALLDVLAARGVVARVDGGELKLKPARSLDAALLAEVRANKADLLTLLTASAAQPSGLVHVSVALREWMEAVYPREVYAPDAPYDPEAKKPLVPNLTPSQRERANQAVTGEAMAHAARCGVTP